MDNSINTKAFGKNDIRGIFPSEVNSEIFFCAAKGYVAFVLEELKKKNQEKTPRELLFTVCMDARTHSPELKRAIIQGVNLKITAIGADISKNDVSNFDTSFLYCCLQDLGNSET